MAQHDDAGRLEQRELAAELAADRTAGTGHQHRLTGRELADLGHVGADRLAPQQVLDLHLAERRNGHATGEDIEHPRHRTRPRTGRVCRVHHFAHHLPGRARHRDDHFLRRELLDEAGQVLERTKHRQVEHPVPVLSPVIVDEPDRLQADLRVAQQFLADQLPGRPGPHDDDPLALRLRASLSAPREQPHAEARERDEDCGEKDVEEENGDGNASGYQAKRRKDERPCQHTGQPESTDCGDKSFNLDDARVPPEAFVDAGLIADGQTETGLITRR